MNSQDEHDHMDWTPGDDEDTEIHKQATEEQLDEVEGGWQPDHTFKTYEWRSRLGPEHA